MNDLTFKNRMSTINACEELYGNFYHNFIIVQNKDSNTIRNEIINKINNLKINIDLYIYIVSNKNNTVIKLI